MRSRLVGHALTSHSTAIFCAAWASLVTTSHWLGRTTLIAGKTDCCTARTLRQKLNILFSFSGPIACQSYRIVESTHVDGVHFASRLSEDTSQQPSPNVSQTEVTGEELFHSSQAAMNFEHWPSETFGALACNLTHLTQERVADNNPM